MPTDSQRCRIRCGKPRLDMTILLGEEPPQITAGYGGWALTDRVKDVSLTTWAGQEPLQLTVSLMLDGFADNESVQGRLRNLELLGRNRRDRSIPPPVFRVLGDAIPHDDLKWVCESITRGDSQANKNGVLVRQAVVLVCREYVRGEQVKIRRNKKALHFNDTIVNPDSGIPGPLEAKYTVKSGDTLFAIAIKFYKDRSKWQRIAKANGLRDPRHLKVGSVLKIPEA